MNLELYEEKVKTGVSLEDIEKNSPDKIDCKQFWKDIESKDTTSIFGGAPKSVEEGVFQNKQLMICSGFLNYLPRFFEKPINIVEIGAGYCPTKSILEKNIPENLYYYYPTDIVARTEEVREIKDGVLPFKDESTHLVVCSNVFQHLSVAQRTRYVDEAIRVLVSGGLFFLGCGTSNPTRHSGKPGMYCKELDRYCSLTGEQFVPMPTMNDIYDMCLGEENLDGFQLQVVGMDIVDFGLLNIKNKRR